MTNHTSTHTPQERRILAILAGRRCTTEELAAMLGVQRRSAERYLNNLAVDGSVVWEQQGRERAYRASEEGVNDGI